MSIVLDGTAGITTPEIVSTGGPLVVNASAPDNSVVVDASGNVGIGTSSPNSIEAGFFGATVNGSSGSFLDFESNGNHNGRIITDTNRNFSVQNPAAFAVTFATNGSERARIDSSGNLLIGCTSLPGGGTTGTAFQLGASNGGMCTWTNRSPTTTASDHAYFYNPNGIVGFIRTLNSATSYSTSSDYRLKENIAPMTDALAKVAALKPCTYTWKVDGLAGQGFIAHELQEVVPDCVVGEKDAVDAEGNPQYQGIDTSFLAGLYAAALQELKAINDAQAQTIESLTARVVALEQA